MHASARQLSTLCSEYLDRSRAPYSGQAASAIALLSDGSWVPGVRVETASFSLVIDAAHNAASTCVAAGRTDIVAIALSDDAPPHAASYLANLGFCDLEQVDGRLFAVPGAATLPATTNRLEVTVKTPASDSDRIQATRDAAQHAYVPASSFPVGCFAVTADGTAIPGVNVEHRDWNRIICAERNALGTAASYGLGPIESLYVSCVLDPDGTPCGACRQVIAELAPGAAIVMDRDSAPPERQTPETLLPGSFTGSAILRRRSEKTAPPRKS